MSRTGRRRHIAEDEEIAEQLREYREAQQDQKFYRHWPPRWDECSPAGYDAEECEWWKEVSER
jgi:hypothetical protein